ncbi:unnamed protein product [Phytophthora fragariaefolia]|uniref:Unnamed protein product n=1 Tax=Phytophthora fragariaefolia TaxID=1490495 RepID=A0A9W6XNX8_9STRA|nr:unnamed protein product [Phytophthora fragariaefolia]
MEWLQDFHTALHTGKLDEFTGREETETSVEFPNLSQVSSAGPEPSDSLSPIPAHQDISRNVSGSAQAPIVFASPPKDKELTRRLKKKKVLREDMKEAKRIRIREGKKAQVVKLSHMEILTGPYSKSSSMQLVVKLELPCVEIRGSLVVQSYKIRQPVPISSAIPQAKKIHEAIQAIEAAGDSDLLVRWDEYGCAIYDQLKLMESGEGR